MTAPISQDWLRSVGFKWLQLDRQPDKHWLLWIGGADGDRSMSYEDLGIELAPSLEGTWHCWLRADYAGRYTRFIHVRHVRTTADVELVFTGLTGRPWDPDTHLYGSARTAEQAARLLSEADRFDYRILRDRPWRDDIRDESIGGALPEHLIEYVKRRGTPEPDGAA